MAKNYIKGASYNLYLNTGSQGSPTWALIKAVEDIDLATNPDDVNVPERGTDMGHLAGENDPAITFVLFEDSGDSNVETLIAAMVAKTMVEIAVARGAIATPSVKYWRQESLLLGVKLGAKRGDVAGYDVDAKRHANSDYAMTRNTAS